MKTLILNIKQLVQTELSPRKWVAGKDMARLGILENAYLLVEEDKIAGFGKMEDLNREAVYAGGDIVKEIDATGRLVMPSYCDSHTHLVYAGSREIEYIDKIRGLSYEEIAKRGGGILNSCERIRKASEEELFDAAYDRIQEIAGFGTGAVEIKSGYGLDTESELKMLRVIRRLKAETPLLIKSTFLGAHAVPLEYKGRQTEYVDLIINEMILKAIINPRIVLRSSIFFACILRPWTVYFLQSLLHRREELDEGILQDHRGGAAVRPLHGHAALL